MNTPQRLPKLTLSEAEWEQAAVPDFILVKNRIIAEVYDIFGCLSDQFREQSAGLAARLPVPFALEPKIAKGEQYLSMPWVMLDYPRCFSGNEGHFAVRCFFWWGHYFSMSWQVSGAWLRLSADAFPALHQKGWFTGLTSDPWDHRLPNETWTTGTSAGMYWAAGADQYGKAAKKWPVRQYQDMFRLMQEAYGELIGEINRQLPSR